MRIESISFRNYRLFDDKGEHTLNFAPDKNVTVIVGNNGSGKTSILDAIAIQLSPFISAFPGYSIKPYLDSDMHIGYNEKWPDYLSVESFVKVKYNGTIRTVRTRKGSVKAPESDVKEIKNYAEYLAERINSGDHTFEIPILAYYGTGRGQIQAPERKRNFQKAFSQWDAYDSALEASTNFKRFFAWYDLMEDEERRERDRIRDFDYKSPYLENVRRALNLFVGKKFTNPRIEIHPLRFVMDELGENGDKRELRIEQMSDGYKIVIAMVADIASRMAEANPNLPDPLNASGIVLIDEADLHLHVKWQREIIQRLTETFPHIQFILTTHSPIMLSGADDLAQFVLLSDQNILPLSNRKFAHYDIGQLLLSELFDLSSTHSPEMQKTLDRQKELLSKTELTHDESTELQAINRNISGWPLGNTRESIQINRLIKEMADRMGIGNE